ncbi:MAG: HAMP domain-containing sensor histidine kinase [Cytophagales bacterium]|nr:HAMP domain-containing sensor histidine kinase [Cytophagales bacterium]
MQNAPIRILIVLATVALAGIIASQMYWVNMALSNENQQFDHSVQMALNNVVEGLCQIEGNDIPLNNPIDRISNNYYIVRTNNRINLESLEYLLKAELEKRAVTQDFEYGLYDCESDRMVYGDLVQLSSSPPIEKKSLFPELKGEAYYFGIYFPGRARGFFRDLQFWQITTMLVIIVILFMGYGLFVILKQKRLRDIQRDFVNNVTHEFKTPIATLKIASEVFANADREQPERLKKYGAIAHLETQRLEGQVSQLLKNSLLERKPKIEKVKLEVRAILDRVVQTLKPVADAAGKTIICNETNEPMYVLGNSDMLEAVFYNLLDNSIKYGGDKIEIEILKDNQHVQMVIGDNGPGIPKAYRSKVWKKFFRVPTGNVHDVKGFGLGLYMVNNIMKNHRGSIVLNNQQGNSFQLKFKLA